MTCLLFCEFFIALIAKGGTSLGFMFPWTIKKLISSSFFVQFVFERRFYSFLNFLWNLWRFRVHNGFSSCLAISMDNFFVRVVSGILPAIGVMILVAPKQEMERKSEWFCGVIFFRSNFKVEWEVGVWKKFAFSLMVLCSHAAISLWFLLFFRFFLIGFSNGFPNPFIVHWWSEFFVHSRD